MNIPDGPNVRGEPHQLLAVMQNLLGNAWKFSARQAQARIEVGCDPGAEGQLRYVVKDNSAGFGTFEQLHSQAEFCGTASVWSRFNG